MNNSLSPFLKYLKNVQFINQNYDLVYLHDILRNNIVIISMFYSNCKGKCIPLARHMYKCSQFIGEKIMKEKNIRFLHISLDPKNDSIEDLNTFKNQIFTENMDNWDFVTGDPKDLENLRFSLGMYDPDKTTDLIKEKHSGMSKVVNEKMNKKIMIRAYENTINSARKIFSLCMPEFYSNNGYLILNKIDYNNFSPKFENSLFNDIQSIHPTYTYPFLPDKYKELFKEKSMLASKDNFKYDPYEEYGYEFKLNKCCGCKK